MSDTQQMPQDMPREVPPDRQAVGRSGRHPVNVGHLVMGTAFVGLALVWLLTATDAIDVQETGWALALPWLVAGAVGLLATVLRGHRDPASATMQEWHSPRSPDH